MTDFVTRFFIFDTESTSLDPLTDDIISLGGVLCSYNQKSTPPFQLIDRFDAFVATKKTIDAAAQTVHHISNADLQACGAREFPVVIEELRAFLCRHQPEPHARLVWMAHNGASFDDVILYTNFVVHRLEYDDFLREVHTYGLMDTLKFLKVLFKGCPYSEQPKDQNGRVRYRLGDCYHSFCGGKNLENAHSALADSEGLLEVLNSDCVSQKITLQNLFKTGIVKVEKAVKALKQKAGVAFQTKEEQTRRLMQGLPADDKGDDELHLTEPVLETQASPEHHHFCLACISFFKDGTHDRCEAVPAAVESGKGEMDVDNIK